MGGAVWVVVQAMAGARAAAMLGAASGPAKTDSTQDTTGGASHERCLAQSLGGQ